MTPSIKLVKRAAAPLAVGAMLSAAGIARADDTIKHPGDHPDYHVEAEPHLVVAFDNVFGSDGFGVGGRFSIPIVQNGFIKGINNNVAIGFGLDFVHYSGFCHYRGYICDATYFFIPVVMQWNFFVAERWSVFGEPGFAIYHGFGFDSCPPGSGDCYDPHATGFFPAVLFLGGRYHFSEAVALTMRIGWPMFSIGVSFFP
jgi:hypothetical protein